MATTAQHETGDLLQVYLKHPDSAFAGPRRLDTQWRALNYRYRPDLASAVAEFDAFARCLEDAGARIRYFEADGADTLDSLYVRDASVICDAGVILCHMGKPAREPEPDAQARAYARDGLTVLGRISGDGRLEGGDVVWLDPRTVAVGEGYRSNAAGITQLRRLLGDAVDQVIPVPLPHWTGPSSVMHLMSLISPIDRDLAVVYSPLMPVPFRDALLGRDVRLVEVPAEEFESLGCNVLALGARRCLMVAGNPVTRRRLEAAGAEVIEFAGKHICLAGEGGPTCLTRPTLRGLRTV